MKHKLQQKQRNHFNMLNDSNSTLLNKDGNIPSNELTKRAYAAAEKDKSEQYDHQLDFNPYYQVSRRETKNQPIDSQSITKSRVKSNQGLSGQIHTRTGTHMQRR